ncbi:hypothetical protein BBO99_00005037 [Phytophthora kernoviae]|uniref:MORN repeat-containing protein 5 n=2 Tax=Phytophthora kernoviae TaxID=325452 RepID=A0A3R7J780_9STRA|nr:hypothetical protein G195_005460 [Phytophthora kernoviae 00238/432]KAG2524885.1 hypothetical protein JM16_004748 [Phytophthora kernoviae]KAG2526649.1 hypothetical protein JM18_004278 [Phytophthora kernoviae]RLN45994.1 hypothetical protein BBI17_005099 [Phytophthora kernoviae]RLN79744.1 hypothetical protein BBO99_00005037 [Phytophthora kernoviae]
MAGKSKLSTAGQGDAKAAAAAAVASTSAPKAEEEQPSEVDDEAVKTGTFSFSDGSKYKGEYCSTGGKVVRQGAGAFWTGAERYEGNWVQDQMHGHGVYKFATGASYDGEFQYNNFHGIGDYRWADGAHYKGGWYFNRMHGDGLYVDKEGVEWRGRFVNGKFDNGRIFHTLR